MAILRFPCDNAAFDLFLIFANFADCISSYIDFMATSFVELELMESQTTERPGVRLVVNAGDAPLCNVTQEYYCGTEAMNDYVTSEDGRVICDCPPQCFRRSYEISSSESVYSDYFLNFMA